MAQPAHRIRPHSRFVTLNEKLERSVYYSAMARRTEFLRINERHCDSTLHRQPAVFDCFLVTLDRRPSVSQARAPVFAFARARWLLLSHCWVSKSTGKHDNRVSTADQLGGSYHGSRWKVGEAISISI